MYQAIQSSQFRPKPKSEHVPPGIQFMNYPWKKEDLDFQRTVHELEIFSEFGGSTLNPFGVNPTYPFCQIFFIRPNGFPPPMLDFFWYLCHQYYVFVEFYCPAFRSVSSPIICQFLSWFQPLEDWLHFFQTHNHYAIIQFHRPAHFSGHEIHTLPSHSLVQELYACVLDQDDTYCELQRLLFQINCCIPKEIWPDCNSGSWNYRDDHPHWKEVSRSKALFFKYGCTPSNTLHDKLKSQTPVKIMSPKIVKQEKRSPSVPPGFPPKELVGLSEPILEDIPISRTKFWRVKPFSHPITSSEQKEQKEKAYEQAKAKAKRTLSFESSDSSNSSNKSMKKDEAINKLFGRDKAWGSPSDSSPQ